MMMYHDDFMTDRQRINGLSEPANRLLQDFELP